ncbi:MAG: membrane protein insertase YidC [Treponema sp.]|jgi:YidC/Oxa1 family membrane protein insertase|nr:membrane protein insertase YidC [Treponema sp.]
MEKRTLLAVVLSIAVISVFYVIQGIFFPPPLPVPVTRAAEPSLVTESADMSAPAPEEPDLSPVLEPGVTAAAGDAEGTAPAAVAEQRITIDTALLRVVLSNAGGDVVSYKLKEHDDQGEPVEMVFAGGPEAGESHAFTLAFGDTGARPVTSYFNVQRRSEYSVEFSRDFVINSGGPEGEAGRFRLTKRYDFKPNEYMFELTINLDGRNSVSSFDFMGAAYTLGFGPQIGPKFEKLDQRYEYRNYYTYANGKMRTEKVGNNASLIINNNPAWAAIAGKYFTLIGIPYISQYEAAFSTKVEPGISSASRLYFIRPALNGSRTEDTYRFYLGPKNQDNLGIYNTGKNDYGLRDMELLKVANTGFWAPLELVLKWFLMIFYRIIPNYGIAIILLTILVKALLFPLTKKGSESTLRMQALSPRIKEIQEKYKDNSQKMNMEMAEFYKKEGYNPLSGCLPMLLQIPIFFAMYSLFNNHFDLRGAMFIPGWIPDLSLPESIWNFSPFRLPILGWSDIRVLPFVYVGSQLLYGKVTQTPDQQGNSQMKIMLYAMPVVFFFVLYDVPSGLLVYWIMSNVLTMVQQLAINKYLAQKRAAMGTANPGPVIAPRAAPKKKKKR